MSSKENPYIGYKFIKKTTDKGVLMEIWQDDPNEEDPKKHWKKIHSSVQAPK